MLRMKLGTASTALFKDMYARTGRGPHFPLRGKFIKHCIHSQKSFGP